MGAVIEAITYLIALCASAYLAVTYVRNEHRLAAVVAATCGLMLAVHRFALPSSMMDLEAQFRLWTPITAVLMFLPAALLVLVFVLDVGGRREKVFSIAASVLLFAALLLPLHRPHFGWSDHAHFVWESPYHVH